MAIRITDGDFATCILVRPPKNQQCLTVEGYCARPITAGKKNLARCARGCVPFSFPQLDTSTNGHQKTESQLTGLQCAFQ